MAQTLNDEEAELMVTQYHSNNNIDFSNEWFRQLVTGLTHSSTLQQPKSHSHYMANGLKMSGSPLWGSISGSGRDSPMYGWDFLYEAGEEVARMRKLDETAAFYSNTQQQPMPVGQNPIPYQRLQLEHLKNKSVREEAKMFQNRKRNEGLSSMGMRPVFLNKKDRTGTGVFLPRTLVEPTTHKKSAGAGAGCSVLLPERVVHALNLNLDSPPTTSHQHRCSNMAPHQQYCDAAAFKLGNNGMMAQPRMKLPVVMNQELRLPQEWTY